MAAEQHDPMTVRLTLAEISRGCGVSAENILVLVSGGALSPGGGIRASGDLNWMILPAHVVRERVRVLEALAFRR